MPSSLVSPASAGKSSAQASAQSARPSLDRQRQTGSSDSSDSESIASLEQAHLIRCLRCQRTLSGGGSESLARQPSRDLDWITNGDGRVRLGVNLYYCARCANMVGLKG